MRWGAEPVRTADVDLVQERFRHDLRQPLAAASMLVDDLAQAGDLEGLAPRLDEVQRLVEWALVMLSDQEEESTVAYVDVGTLLRDHCWSGAYDSAVSYVVRRAASVVVNPVELIRAFRNLVDNALRASGPGGLVEVEVTRDDDDALLVVSDSGPGFGGIRPVHGQGLVVVRRFAERYGGRVRLGRSDLGGAAVSVRVPLALDYGLAGITDAGCPL